MTHGRPDSPQQHIGNYIESEVRNVKKGKKKKTASDRKQPVNVQFDLNLRGVTESNCDNIFRKYKESVEVLFKTFIGN